LDWVDLSKIISIGKIILPTERKATVRYCFYIKTQAASLGPGFTKSVHCALKKQVLFCAPTTNGVDKPKKGWVNGNLSEPTIAKKKR
jgi:hypothetical protein